MIDPFKWRHDESEIILTCVRWYLRYSLSDRDLEEMMTERGKKQRYSVGTQRRQDRLNAGDDGIAQMIGELQIHQVGSVSQKVPLSLDEHVACVE